MKKAIILARVSTVEQEKTGLSIQNIQLPQMKEYAIENNFEVIKEFIFQETASQKLRKKFDEMIEYVKQQKDVEVVIAFRVDRMTRNYRDAVNMDTLRTEYGKELHFVNDRLVLKKDTYGREIQDWDTKVYLAKQHINRCQEDANSLLFTKLKSGEQYGKAPFGYRNMPKENAERVVIDDFEAGIVKKIFNTYTTKADSYLSIANKLNKEYPSLELSKRKVEFILTNPYYYGETEHKGKFYPHKYKTIISKEIFEMTTEIREGRRKTNKKGKLASKTGIYRGLIYCDECGCSYSPSPNRHKKLNREVQSETYYYCTNSKGKHKKKPKGTNDYELTTQFAEIFKKLQIPKKDLDWLTNALKESHEGKKEFTINEVKHCRTQIDKNRKRIEQAYEDKLDGRLLRKSMTNFVKNGTKKKKTMKVNSLELAKPTQSIILQPHTY